MSTGTAELPSRVTSITLIESTTCVSHSSPCSPQTFFGNGMCWKRLLYTYKWCCTHKHRLRTPLRHEHIPVTRRELSNWTRAILPRISVCAVMRMRGSK